MQDRFRFRAWNENLNKMHYLRGLAKPYGGIKLSMVLYFDGTESGSLVVYLDRIKLMQCTGIRSHNTLDLVYEGDILQDCDLEKWIVVWHNRNAQFYCKNLNDDSINIDFQQMRIFQIIGNIYEDPELMEVKNAG
jgi:hypothetical protein